MVLYYSVDCIRVAALLEYFGLKLFSAKYIYHLPSEIELEVGFNSLLEWPLLVNNYFLGYMVY